MLSNRTPLVLHVLPHPRTVASQYVRDGLLVVVGTILMALCAQISFYLPWNPLVPVTMQTFGVVLIGALYGPRLGALTLIAYLLEALAGLPVLAGGLNAWSPSRIPGLPVIIGPTAGYLFAFPIAAFIVGALAERGWDRRVMPAVVTMLLGHIIITIIGVLWLIGITIYISGSVDLLPLLAASVLPFIPGNLVKTGLAALALPGGWSLVKRLRNSDN